MRLLQLFFCLLFFSGSLIAQGKPSLEAIRIDEPIKIDGFIDEAAWTKAPVGSDFTNLQPVPWIKPAQSTDIRVVYNDRGFYIGASLHDASPDSILMELTERDDLGNTDWFGISLDPYNSGQNGFAFLATPANVQYDAQYSTDGEDENWDAVWQSKSVVTADGWSVEIFVPYSAIRFPKTSVQDWTINFVRNVQRNGEKSFWAAIDPTIDGYLNQCGKLVGIKNVKAPIRIQATPFLAAYGLKSRAAGADEAVTGTSITGGMDVKVGLSDAFTLDMTLIPDFGEARSDDQILNLGPFEQRFDEQRAFFTEGTELFNKGGFFYSRRVGGGNYFGGALDQEMLEGETVVDNPQRAKLYNATKISGRTAQGTGIGFFNAVEQANYATVTNAEGESREILTNPLTNYNVAVIDQNLKNNSSVTLINTNVLREGAAADANVTGLLFDLHNNANKYAIRGNFGYSQRFLPEETSTGHVANFRLEKISGNWTWAIGAGEESDTYDPNDLGILFANNSRELGGVVRYNRNKPFFNGYFLNGGAGLDMEYNTLYKPGKFTGAETETWVYAQTKHFWNVNFWAETSLADNFDYFEPRVKGRYLRNPGQRNIGGWIGTDRRKAIRLSTNFNNNGYYGEDRSDLYLNVNARWRLSDRLSLNTGVFRGQEHNEVGYVNRETVETEAGTRTDVFMGKREVTSIEASLSGKYSFSANMTLNLRVRHYWSGVSYNSFHLLAKDGTLAETDYDQNHNQDFDAFNVDLIYRWRFAPGSDMFVVYKSSITDFDQHRSDSYSKSFSDLWQDTPRNGSVSLKVVYWLDYASLVKG
ncbi:DUF5916 domain-containing protein [Neolewinella persica]|uniref:DUF5916 domain-containing protein n=1 Tax=Neolewinella persica TaxID=70998 RepID=UPI0003AA77CD|nr:DUF5916 domain-containing protein [Neolewinella persica]